MVEILLATFNAEKYLPTLLDSIYNQDYSDFLILARDDCSKDGTINILKEYQEKYGKMKIISAEKNLGAKENFRELIKNADGDYIMFADCDDKWNKDKISTTLAGMQAAQCALDAPILVHTDLSVADKNLNVIDKSFTRSQGFNMKRNKFSDFLAQNTVTGCAMMINKKLLSLAKQMPKEALMHDWWLSLVASAFGKVVYVDTPTILYRQHEQNQVGAVKKDYVKDRKKTAKQRLINTYKQADAFAKTYGEILPEKEKQIVTEYANCLNKGKIKRVASILKNGTTKQGILKTLAQIYYC